MPNFRPLSETKFINDANLVSYWKLDGNSNDSKGTNNGTDTNISYVAGKYGQAASFNGSSSYITLPDSASLRVTSAFTISANIKTTATTHGSIVGNTIINTNDYSGWYIDLNGVAGKFRFGISPSNGTGTTNYIYSTINTNNDGNWHNLVATYDGTTMRIYIDGVFNGSVASANPSYDATSFASIGSFKVNGSITSIFNGLIEDVSIFSRALSASEVNELYQGMTYGEYLGAGSATTKLLLHLNGNSTDSSGNGNNGTDTSITYSLANGKFGQGAGFNGSSSKIDITTTNFPFGSSNRTLSLWVKQANQPGNEVRQPYFIYGERATNQCFGLDYYNNSGTLKICLDTWNNNLNIVKTLETGVWYNIIGIVNNKTMYLYLNGDLIGSGLFSSINTVSGEFHSLGARRDASYVNGSIDEVILENRAWTSEEIKKYYTMTKGRYATL